MVLGLGHDPEPMMVNRLGEDHWQFLDMKSRMELYVSLTEQGQIRATVWMPEKKGKNRI